MRTDPTVTFYNFASGSNVGTLDFFNGSAWVALTSAAINTVSSAALTVYATKTSGFTQWVPQLLGGNFTASAEI
jgi:hypothetical protein